MYLCQSRTAPFNSDGAANVLQARAITGGNPLLRGWWTSDVSFYTTELPEYALVTALRGLAPDVVHWCGALSYTLTVLLAALLAKGPRLSGPAGPSGPSGWAGGGWTAGWFRPGVTVAIMLAPSILGGTEVFLENPDHAGTAVPVLAVLLLIDRYGGRDRPGGVDRAAGRWLVPLGVALLLALAQVGDELTLAAATVPLAVVSAVRLLYRPRVAGRPAAARPAPGRLAGERRPDAALLAAAAAAPLLAWLAGLAIRGLGGFDQRPLGGVTPAPLASVPGDARLLGQSLMLLFGANQPGPPHLAQTVSAHPFLVAMAVLHLTGLLLAGIGLAAGISAVAARRADRVTAALVVAVLVLAAAGLFTTLLRSLSNAHEVAVLLPLGAVLAGRTLPPLGAALAGRALPPCPGSARPGGHPARPFGPVGAALACWLVISLAELGYAAAWPAAAPAQQAVADWLIGQHQHAGLAGYWQAAATTVTSGGRVVVAPVVMPPAGRQSQAGKTAAEADRWESDAAWYQPGGQAATFVIAVTGPAAPGRGLPAAAVRARFGPPAAQHRIGQLLIMLYRYNLLTRLGGTSFPGTG